MRVELPVLTKTGQVLPPLYAAWMDELLKSPIPAESEATCDDCAMCNGVVGEQKSSAEFFDASVKCCSYVPVLPNFLVGSILANEEPEAGPGRAAVMARLESHLAATPLGLEQSATDKLLYEHVTRSKAFGRSATVRCPYYLDEAGGSCAIWRHRNAVCTTWFCKHIRGALGKGFWTSIRHLLSTAERHLAYWCVAELEVGTDALRRLPSTTPEFGQSDPVAQGRLDGVPDPKNYRADWGRWANREAHFFRECARLVSALSWDDVVQICGPEVRISARVASEDSMKLKDDALPARLRVGPYHIVRTGPDCHRVQTYSQLDPLDVPAPLVDGLHYFDGRPTDEALHALAVDGGIELHNGLVHKLIDFQILVPQ